MRSFACVRAGAWIDRRRSGLSTAEQIRLEQHLSQCARCSADAEVLDLVVATLDNHARPRLSQGVRERAIAVALLAVDHRDAGKGPSGRRVGAAAALAVAGALAAGIVIARIAVPRSGTELIVSSGEVRVAESSYSPGDAPTVGALIEARAPASLSLGDSRVSLEAGTALRWNEARAAIRLEAGAISLDVPHQRAALAVVTDRFRVEVVGTAFRVDLEGVSVSRGVVRVRDPGGAVLDEAVRAGERWTVSAEANASLGADVGHVIAPAISGPSSIAEAVPDEPPELRPEPGVAWRPSDVRAAIADARRDLASGRIDEARAAARRALDGRAAGAERAEARTLLAECSAAEGDHAGAARAFVQIAERYRGTAAGENALFAAASQWQAAGDRGASERAFDAYLERYPSGRFAREARQGRHR